MWKVIEYAADYYPYGKVLREYSSDQREKFLTTQHERDLETDFDYRGARYFDAEYGRFLSVDPTTIAFGAGWEMGRLITYLPVYQKVVHPSDYIRRKEEESLENNTVPE